MEEATTMAVALHFAAGRGKIELPESAAEEPVVRIFRQVMADTGGDCVPVRELMERTAERLGGGWEPTRHSRELAAWIFHAARLGGVELRSEALVISREAVAAPRVSPLNRHFAANGQPVVDPRHVTCRFPAGHERLLAAMDGSRPIRELEADAAVAFPELDFDRWLDYLVGRGIVECGAGSGILFNSD